MERGKDLTDHGNRTGKLGVAEENPAEAHEMESDNHGKHTAPSDTAVSFRTMKQAAEELVYGKCYAVQSAPYDEIPRSTVPESAQQHGQNQVDVGTDLAFPVAAQRNVEVIAQPGGQGDVPAMPKIGHAVRLIGGIEVDGETEAQQQGDTDGHVAVTREVAVYLQGIAVYAKEVLHSGIQAGIVENAFYKVDADIVGDDGFLEQTAHDEEDSFAEHFLRNEQGLADLGNKIAGTHNRSCYQLGEEGYIKDVVQQVIERLQVTAVYVEGIAQRLEGEEGNTDRQEDVEGFVVAVPQRTEHFVKEVSVFEIAQQSQINTQTYHDQQLALPEGFGTCHPSRQQEVAHGDNSQ